MESSEKDKLLAPASANGYGSVAHESVALDQFSINAGDLVSDGARLSGPRLLVSQLHGMIVKRLLHTRRNVKVSVAQTLVPAFFVILGLIVMRTYPGASDAPALALNLKTFYRPKVPFIARNNLTNKSETSLRLTRLFRQHFRSNFNGQLLDLDAESAYGRSFLDLEEYLLYSSRQGVSSFTSREVLGAEFVPNRTEPSRVRVTAHFNDQAFHTSAISLAAALDAVVKVLVNGSSFSCINHPLPRTLKEQVDDNINKPSAAFLVSFQAMFGMSVLGATFTLFLVKERATKAKHVQFVSGVRPITFWLATFLWDVANYLVPCLLLLVIFAAFDLEAYSGEHRLGIIFLLLLLFGWALLPFMYLWSFLFRVPSSSFVWLTCLNVITGIATTLTVTILSIPQLNLVPLSRALGWVFMVIFPNYCFGAALQDMAKNYQFLQFKPLCDVVRPECDFLESNPCCPGKCGDDCILYQEDYLAWEPTGIGRYLFFMMLQGVVLFALLLLAEYGVFTALFYRVARKPEPMNGSYEEEESSETSVLLDRQVSLVAEDEDVFQERQFVQQLQLSGSSDGPAQQASPAPDLALVLDGLSKQYGPLLAVDSLCLGVSRGECFGLLGVNGAGKTTTFKMLTGDELVTSGNAYVRGFNVRQNLTQVRRQLGYCPQFDALVDQMTGREMLRMFGRLRGIPSHALESSVESLMTLLHFHEHADKYTKDYSGGNKRKLSTAIALIGSPPLVFLDEPSTGMDPVAKRMLWDALSRVREAGTTLILTSHSMDECEALCTRLSIMVNGTLRCLGSTQHLKTRFGDGYTLIVKLPEAERGCQAQTDAFCHFVNSTFPGAALKDLHQGLVQYHVPASEGVSWTSMFSVMEEAKMQFHLKDYYVSQTTLEQVFLNLARSQAPPQRLKRPWFKSIAPCCYPNSGYVLVTEDQ